MEETPGERYTGSFPSNQWSESDDEQRYPATDRRLLRSTADESYDPAQTIPGGGATTGAD